MPEALLETYADELVVSRTLPAIERWLDYLDRHRGAWRPHGGFGDWLAPEPTPTPLVVEAYLAIAARVGSELALQLGECKRMQKFARIARKAQTNFRKKWITEAGVPRPPTQTACVLALRTGALDDEATARTRAALIADVRARKHHLTTGFLGTPWLLEELVGAGAVEDALEVLLQRDYPGWLYPIIRGGATSMW